MRDALVIDGLSTGYGRKRVLHGLSLPAFGEGELVAVMGPNAAGKSTLLKAILGILPADDGAVRLFGEDLTRLPMKERARRVGYLPQMLPQSTTLVAYELVLSAARAMHDGTGGTRAIENFIERVFDLLDIRDLALRRMSEMSGGQRQMVGLAQVLVRRPQLLLLDEPTSALDLRWQLRVLEAVREMMVAERTVCLLAVHDLNLALRFADRVVLLGPEGLLAAGPPGEALTPDILGQAYGVEARVETCSLGYPIVLADRVPPRGAEETPRNRAF